MPYKKTSSQSVSVSDLVGKAQPSEPEVAPVVEEAVQSTPSAAPVEETSSVLDAAPRRIHVDHHDGQQRSHYGNGGGSYHHQQSVQVTPTEEVKGFLDVQPEGHGFLRPKFIPSARDIYISQSQIRRFMLRPG